jgi:hypothetical protein
MTEPMLTVPSEDGELIVQSDFAEWAALARANRAAAAQWEFEVAGRDIGSLRILAREAVGHASEGLSAKLGVPLGVPIGERPAPDSLLIMTGHQPALFHPGVWIKDFLMQRLAEETGAMAVDLVVDSDGFETVGASVPSYGPPVRRRSAHLVVAEPGACYALTPVPSGSDIQTFCRAVERMLGPLPSETVRANFATFCEGLRDAASEAANLAELLTIARRRHERAAGTDYRELSVTALAATEAFAWFVADMALSARRFVDAYNAELHSFRSINKTRSAAQPVPDLRSEDARFELPLWVLAGGTRTPVWAEEIQGGGVRLLLGESAPSVELPASGKAAVRALEDAGCLIVPKALALTLFARVFCCDLFIHGLGGGRYDAVTDGVCRRYYGVEPPRFAMASLTLHLPLPAQPPAEADIGALQERMNRITHNPDAFVGEVEFDDPVKRRQADELVAEKAALLEQIAAAGADKKALGQRIRDVNAELGNVVEPVRSKLAETIGELEGRAAAAEILGDRTYAFCYWSADEMARWAGKA